MIYKNKAIGDLRCRTNIARYNNYPFKKIADQIVSQTHVPFQAHFQKSPHFQKLINAKPYPLDYYNTTGNDCFHLFYYNCSNILYKTVHIKFTSSLKNHVPFRAHSPVSTVYYSENVKIELVLCA